MNRVVICLLCFCFIKFSWTQEKVKFKSRHQNQLRGDIVFFGNNILNSNGTTEIRSRPNVDQNNTSLSNDQLYMDYVNKDNDGFDDKDGSVIFSASKATLNLQSCSKIIFAGLYWSASYPYQDINNQSVRESDWNQVKLSFPKSNPSGPDNYIDLTADQVIYDGNNASEKLFNEPYICFKDITSLMNAQADISGVYTVANVRSTTGRATNINGFFPGWNAGWGIVVIYENANEKIRFLDLFDGYTHIPGGNGVKNQQFFSFEGFQSVPSGPVNAKMGIGALEGDYVNKGDYFAILGASNPSYPIASFPPTSVSDIELVSAATSRVSNGKNDIDNFFNSTISQVVSGTAQTMGGRDTNSENTLGWDLDIFEINNPGNSVIGNNETELYVELGTSATASYTADTYGVFLASLAIEVNEPEIELKHNFYVNGNVVSGGTAINLGDEFEQRIEYRNVGNDDAENVLIKTVLHPNIELADSWNPGDVVKAGVSFQSYTSGTRELIFSLDNNLFADPINRVWKDFSFKVKTLTNCIEYKDYISGYCPFEVQGRSQATYKGVASGDNFTGEYSSTSYDGCGFPSGSTATVKIKPCEPVTEASFCGPKATLTAGTGYDQYIWFDPVNGWQAPSSSNTYEASFANDDSYKVRKIKNGCTEAVELFNLKSTPEHPLINTDESVKADKITGANGFAVSKCPNNGELFLDIFKCKDSALEIALGYNTPPYDITVEEFTCGSIGSNEACAIANDGCSRVPGPSVVSGGVIKFGTDIGSNKKRYLLTVKNGGCVNTYEFNIYQNDISTNSIIKEVYCKEINKEIQLDIVSTDGIPNNGTYEYSFDGKNYETLSGTIEVQLNSAGIFNADAYFRPVGQNSTSGCLVNIEVNNVDFDVNVNNSSVAISCNDTGATVTAEILGGKSDYTYSLKNSGGANVITPITGPSTTLELFVDGSDSNLTLEVSDSSGSCPSVSKGITVSKDIAIDLNVIPNQDVICDKGKIEVTVLNGTLPYAVYINSATDFQTVDKNTAEILTVDEASSGQYDVYVKDKNGCQSVTKRVALNSLDTIVFNSESKNVCNDGSGNNGQIEINVVSGSGNFIYSYTNNDTGTTGAFDTSLNTHVFDNLASGSYTIKVKYKEDDSDSCVVTSGHVIDFPDAISATLDWSNVGCWNDSPNTTGSLVITATGGSGNFEYQLSPPSVNGFDTNNTKEFEINTAYAITVRDAQDTTCDIVLTGQVDLKQISMNNPNIDYQPNCITSTGQITFSNVQGGFDSYYTYFAKASDGNVISGTSPVLNGLEAGVSYAFYVTDAKGCPGPTSSRTMKYFSPLTLSVSNIEQPSCIGDANGKIEIALNGYNKEFDYVLSGTLDAGGVVNTKGSQSGKTLSLSSLSAGDYEVLIEETKNPFCKASISFKMEDPLTALDYDLEVSDANCNAGGTIKIDDVTGIGGYSYSISGSGVIIGPTTSGTSFATFDNLAVGNYDVTVEDQRGCQVTSGTFEIEKAILKLDITPDTYCVSPSDDNITLEITVSSGTGPFSYTHFIDGTINSTPSGSTSTITIANQGAGEHSVEVEDLDSGCTVAKAIKIESRLSASINKTKDLTCKVGDEDGAFEINVKNDTGYPTYTYNINVVSGTKPVVVTSTVNSVEYTVANNAIDENYEITVEDAQGCTISLPIVFEAAKDPVLSGTGVTIINDIKCFGDNGVIEITNDTSVGEKPFVYWLEGTSSTNPVFPNVSSGSYTIRVTDNKNCEVTSTFEMKAPELLTGAKDISFNAIECKSSNTSGSIEISIVGGTSDYIFSVGNGVSTVTTGASTVIFDNLADGTYIPMVIDSNLCEKKFDPIPLGPPRDLDIAVKGANSSVCGTTVTLDIVVSGGNPDYDFTLYNGNDVIAVNSNVAGTSTSFINIEPGYFYTVEVVDVGNCVYKETMSQAVALSATLVTDIKDKKDVGCLNSNDGSVRVEVTGNSATSLEYELRTDSGIFVTSGTALFDVSTNSYPVDNIPPGQYYIVTKETGLGLKNCVGASSVFEISTPNTDFSIVLDNKKDQNCDDLGQIIVSANGGYGNYEFTVASGTGSLVLTGTSTINVNTLVSGTYNVTVIDQNNSGTNELCAKSIVGIDIKNLVPDLDADVANQCSSTNGLFEIVVTPKNGKAPYIIDYDDGNGFVSSTTSPPVPSGTYPITVEDSNGCRVTKPIEVNNPLKVNVVETDAVTCTTDTAKIQLQPSGGTGKYTYVLSGGTLSSSISGTYDANVSTVFPEHDLEPGSYSLVFTDIGNSCTWPIGGGTHTITVKDAVRDFNIVSGSINKEDVRCFGEENGVYEFSLAEAGSFEFSYKNVLTGDIKTGSNPNKPNFTNLASGTYQLIIKSNDNECIDPDPNQFTISGPEVLSGSYVSKGYACDTANNALGASLDIDAVGGTLNPSNGNVYTYVLSGSGINLPKTNTTGDFNFNDSSTTGTFTIIVSDFNGCETIVDSGDIIPSLERISNMTILESNVTGCNPTLTDLEVSLSGTSTYTYDILIPNSLSQPGNPKFLAQESNTSTDYLIRATDNVTQCYEEKTIKLDPKQTLEMIIDDTNAAVSCKGKNDGEIVLTFKGYIGDVIYKLSGPVTIAETTINLTSLGANNVTNPMLSALEAGNYTVEAWQKSEPSCRLTETFVVAEPTTSFDAAINVTDITCVSSGTLDIDITGGYGSYKINVLRNSSPFNTDLTQTFYNDLTIGTYEVTIEDAGGCILDVGTSTAFNFSMTAPVNPVAGVLSKTDLTCSNSNDGALSNFQASGGTPNYEYALVTPFGTSSFNSETNFNTLVQNLSSGDYSVIVKDSKECQANSNTVTIGAPAEVILSLVDSQELSCTKTKGDIKLEAKGGSGVYEIKEGTASTSWTSFVSNSPITLGEGDYIYYLRDSKGCESTSPVRVSLSQPSPLVIKEDPDYKNPAILCYGDTNAQYKVIASGGSNVGNKKFDLYLIDNTTSPATEKLIITQELDKFENLVPGDYKVVGRSDDCVSNELFFKVTDATEIIANKIDISDATCNGETGEAVIAATGGNGTLVYSLDGLKYEVDGEFLDLDVLLLPDTYTYFVQDDSACLITGDFNIKEPAPIEVTIVDIDQEACEGDNNGSFEVVISGGTSPYFTSLESNGPFNTEQYLFTGLQGGNSYNVYVQDSAGCKEIGLSTALTLDLPVDLKSSIGVPSYNCDDTHNVAVLADLPNLLYELNGDEAVQYGEDNVFEALVPGDYKVEVIDIENSGCSAIHEFTLESFKNLEVIAEQTHIDELTITVVGGQAIYNYSIDGGANFTTNNVFKLTENGVYQVVVEDANGCRANVDIQIDYTEITIPDFFTPNGDGENDYWYPQGLEFYPEATIQIFDRIGRIIAEYKGDVDGWDGLYKEKELPIDDYWYIFKPKGEYEGTIFTGHFNLYKRNRS